MEQSDGMIKHNCWVQNDRELNSNQLKQIENINLKGYCLVLHISIWTYILKYEKSNENWDETNFISKKNYLLGEHNTVLGANTL